MGSLGGMSVVDHDGTETTEELVVVSFGHFDFLPFLKDARDITLHDLVSAAPSCEVDGCRFVGKYEHSLGSTVLFAKHGGAKEGEGDEEGGGEDEGDAAAPDPVTISLLGASTKVLRFELASVPVPAATSSSAAGEEGGAFEWRAGLAEGVTLIRKTPKARQGQGRGQGQGQGEKRGREDEAEEG